MLTLQQSEIVEIHKRSTRSKKAHASVYYSHTARDKTSNGAPAAGPERGNAPRPVRIQSSNKADPTTK